MMRLSGLKPLVAISLAALDGGPAITFFGPGLDQPLLGMRNDCHGKRQKTDGGTAASVSVLISNFLSHEKRLA
jgi:hypothetical protein